MPMPSASPDPSPTDQQPDDERDRSSFSIVPPLLRSVRGLAIYYVLVIPVIGTAAYYLVLGGEHLQTAVYLTVGLLAVLSLSYTGWLVRELVRQGEIRSWIGRIRSQTDGERDTNAATLQTEDA